MRYNLQFKNAIPQTVNYEDLYINPFEKELIRSCKECPYSVKIIDACPVYCFEGKRFICYRRKLKEEQELLIIQEHIKSPTYLWKDNAYCDTISIYYFMNIKKNEEWSVPWALSMNTQDGVGRWKSWGVLEDGTILSPSETNKLIKLLKNKTTETESRNNYTMTSVDDCESNMNKFEEGGSSV